MAIARFLRKRVPVVVAGALLIATAVTTTLEIVAANELFIDYAFYRAVGERFLADGTYYLPSQLSGPYDVALMSDVLYPPTALVLFMPFVWLPAVLWWAIPIGVTAVAFSRLRPSIFGITVMLVLLSWPRAHAAYLFGNTDIWVAAGVAAGVRWGWPAILITLKPVFLPFAAIGVRHRGWWVGMVVLVGIAIAQLPLWIEYPTVMRDVRIDPGYSLGSIPLLLVPIVAWWTGGRARLVRGGSAYPTARSGLSATPSASA